MQKRNLTLIFIFIIGLVLRLYRLGANDLWYDEALSFNFAENLSFSYIIRDLHPPLYYLFLSSWIKIFGASELALRLPSVIFSAAAILVIYKIGEIVFNHKTGILAALIFALSPFQVWYAQEARSYALSVFLVSLAFMFLSQILYRDKMYFWKYFLAASLLAVLTEYINFLILLSVTPIFLFKKRLFKKWVSSWAIIFLGFSPYIYPFWMQISKLLKKGFWIPSPSLFSIIKTLKNFVLGYESTLGIFLIFFSFFAAFGVFKLLKDRPKLIFATLPFFSTIIVIFIISKYIPRSIYLDRQLISVSIFYYILISSGILMINGRAIKILHISLIVIFLIFSLKDYYVRVLPGAKKPFKPLAEFINSYKKEGDIIIFGTPAAIYVPLKFYYLRDMKFYFFMAEADYGHIVRYSEDYYKVIDLREDMSKQKVKRAWLLRSSWERDGTQDYYSESAKRWMLNYGRALKTNIFDGIFVDLFSVDT